MYGPPSTDTQSREVKYVEVDAKCRPELFKLEQQYASKEAQLKNSAHMTAEAIQQLRQEVQSLR